MPERKTRLERFAPFSVWAFPGALGHALVSVPPRDGAHGEQEEGARVGGACKFIGCLLVAGGGGAVGEQKA